MQLVSWIATSALLVALVAAENYCGTSYGDANKCHTPCPNGLDGECPSGERCYASASCSKADQPESYCGVSYVGAAKCTTACPSAVDSECPPGERCFAAVSCNQQPPDPVTSDQPVDDSTPKNTSVSSSSGNFCGTDFGDSGKCQVACPGGIDIECPAGESCFAGVSCNSACASGTEECEGACCSPGQWCERIAVSTTFVNECRCRFGLDECGGVCCAQGQTCERVAISTTFYDVCRSADGCPLGTVECGGECCSSGDACRVTLGQSNCVDADLQAGADYVAMGDSFSSGFGITPYQPGTNEESNDCQRSLQAYPQLVANRCRIPLDFVACQGGRIRHMYEARSEDGVVWESSGQLEAIGWNTTLVTFSIGGNDGMFAAVLTRCLLLVVNCEDLEDDVQLAIECLTLGRDAPAEKKRKCADGLGIYSLLTVLDDIRKRAPEAQVAVLGYPRLFDPDPDGSFCFLAPSLDERAYINEKVDQANSALQRVTLQSGAAFVNTDPYFQDHRFCRASSFNDDVWFFPLESAGRVHPTIPGHKVMADAVLDTVSCPPPRF